MLGGLVPFVFAWFGVGEILHYETDVLDNEVIEIIFGVIFIIACVLMLFIIFAGWFLNTFVVFLSSKSFVLDENRLRKIKRWALWGMVLLIVVGGLNAWIKYIKDNVRQKEDELNEVYRLKPGDLQYSDSIVICKIGDKDRVYNHNTGSVMHEGEIFKILPFDTVPESKVVYMNEKGDRGFLNVVTGAIDIKAEYNYAWLFSEGIAAVVKDDKIGFIDKDNNVVIPFQYPMYASYVPYTYRFYNGYCKMTDEDGRCGLIDHEGKWVIEPKYERIKRPVFGKYRKVKLDGKWGLLDENLKLILSIKYDHITVVDSMAQRFEVTYDGKMYEMDRNGKLLEQMGYAYMHPFYEPEWRYGSYERMSGRYMQVWVRQEYEVDYREERYDFVVDEAMLRYGAKCFRSGIIDVIENKVVVPVEYREIEFINLPEEIDAECSFVFRCTPGQSIYPYYADSEWISLDGKKIRIKYE